MKNSTFSAQVANNLLKVLQGYTKGIRFIALLTMLCTIGVGQMWAETATLAISSSVTANGTLTDDGGNSWSVTSDGSYTSNAKYIQVGTNSKSVTYLKLSTSAFSTKSISKIQVWATSKASTKVTTKVYVGGNLLGTSSAYTSQTAASGGTEFSVTNPNNYTGDILIEISRPSAAKGAIYFNKAIVTYTEAGTPAASELTNAQFAWSAATAEATMPSTFEDQPTLTNTLGLDVSYSSSTPAVATINATSGAIDLVGAGTTTISATFAGGKIGGTTYAAKTVSYTLTVKPAPLVIEPIDGGIIDILTHDCLAATSSNYTNFSDKQAKNDNHSDAVYAGRSSRNGNSTQYSIQLNTIDKGRIATTTTGGLAKRVYVRWATQATLNTNNRSLYIYGSNDAFTGSETSTSATKIGTITFTTGATEAYVDLTGDYKYILMTGSGAIYMDEIQITWIADQSALTAPTFTPAAGTYNAVQNVTISAEEGTTIYYTLDGENPTTESEVYSSAIEIGETTTVKAIAVKNEKVSPVATATYTINLPLTTMDQIFAKATAVGSTATSVEITFGNWVVSAVKEDGKTAYVTDGRKGFIIYTASHGFLAGDILSGTVSCKVQLYKGSAELTELTSTTTGLTVSKGGEVTPIELDEEGIATLTGINTGSVIKINGTCSQGNIISDIQLYNTLYSFEDLTVGAKYEVTGVYLLFESTKEILPRGAEDIVKTQALPTATISIANISLEIEKQATIEATITPDAAKNTVTYTIKSGDEYITLNGTTITAKAVGEATITATIPESIGNYSGTTKDFTVTVTPKNIATLPFTFDDGKAEIEGTLGMSQKGLDDDYASSPKLKFDGTGDYVIIHFDSKPGTLKYDIKGNSFSGGTFTVQESADGSAYTNIVEYTELGSTETKTHALAAASRYVKFIYTEKVSGNVALGNIKIYSPASQLETPTGLEATNVTHNSATLSWGEVANASSYLVTIVDGGDLRADIPNTQTSHTFEGLTPSTKYLWTVKAIGDGITYTNSEESETGEFTTSAAASPATITLSELGVPTTDNTTYYVGETYTLPTTSSQSCAGKQLVGWSTVEVAETDTKPTENYYELGAKVTLAETQTFYAVFATSGEGGIDDTDYSNVHTSNVALDNTGGTNATNSQVKIGEIDYTAVKAGTGSASGAVKITVPTGTTKLSFHIAGWNKEGGKTISLTGATATPSSFTTVADAGVSGSSTTYTLSGTIADYFYSTTLSNINTETTLTFSNGGADQRFVIWGVNASTGGGVSYSAYTTSCGTYTVTFYGFNSGGYTTICNDNPAEIAVAQGETYQIPNCKPTDDPAGLGRTFAGTWNTQANGKGTAYEPGEEFIVNSDTTLYAQWALNTSENTTLPTDVEDLATTDIVVTGGTTLTLQAGTTTINSLTLKGGLQENGTYAMPVVNIPNGATLVRNNNKINLDLKVNNKSYYPFAVPFEVENTAANVNYINSTLKDYVNEVKGYGTYYRILEYNGALRAENGVNSAENWVQVGRTGVKLMPGKGYAISAVPAAGDDTVTIRITMTVDNAWLANGELTTVNEVTRNAVAVAAHTGAAATEHQRHAGWNFVANPYLSNFAGSEASNKDGSFITGELLINKGEYYYDRDDDVPYVTIPTYNFAHYYQLKLSEATLSPAYSFFVQVGDSGTMTFGRQQAPASIAARNAEERPVKMDVDITLSDNHSSDQTGIIISDRYSEAYEIGRDLEKLFGSAYNLSVYTLMADNTPLAFQALAIRSSMQVIPVGYRAPEQGEYTFRLNEATSSIDLLNEQYEQLVLVDYQTGELTNLLIADYTFYSERTQADNRFAIYAVPRQNAPTDLPNAIGQDKQAQKIIHNGHLYILRDGNVYNGNGQIVK